MSAPFRFPFFAIILACVFALSTSAQENPMTNADVVSLLKAGLPATVVVSKIRTSKTNFDTSTNAILALNKDGVPSDVISAMLETKGGYSESPTPPKNSGSPAAPPTDDSDPALRGITEPGIYVYQDGKMSAIEPTVFSGTKMNPLASVMTYGLAKMKIKAKVRGSGANMRIANAQPVFYFVFNPDFKNSGAVMAGTWLGLPATSPAEFMMVQMAVKSASREATIGSYQLFSGSNTGADDKDVREYKFDKVRPGIYKVVPKSSLATGEYCFYYAADVSGLGISGGKIFDFGIAK